MNVVTSYVHALEGRLRIKIPEVKGSPELAREVESHLQLLSGMMEVSASTFTGNVLILYDPRLLRGDQIICTLMDLGYLEEASSQQTRRDERPAAMGLLTSTVASTLMEMALTRLVAALI